MRFLKAIFRKQKKEPAPAPGASKRTMNLDEEVIAGIALLVGSPTLDINEDDALRMFSMRHSHTGRHRIQVIHTARKLKPTTTDMQLLIEDMVSRDILASREGYLALVDAITLTEQRPKGEKDEIAAAFLVFRDDSKKSIVLLPSDAKILFQRKGRPIFKPDSSA